MLRRALLGAALVAAVAASAAAARGVRIAVHPPTGHAHTTFALTFLAPATTGSSGSQDTSYAVTATGPQRRRCGASTVVPIPPTRRGRRVTVKLAPPASPRGWCTGAYVGELRETIRPVCNPGVACPLYIASVIVGRFRFVVR